MADNVYGRAILRRTPTRLEQLIAANAELRKQNLQIDPMRVRIQQLELEVRSLRSQLGRDSATNLSNRRSFEEKAVAELQRRRSGDLSYAMVVIDLDNFKLINDTYGHPVGDVAIERFADVLTRAIRRADLVGRMGGDEFAILFINSTPGNVDATMRAIKSESRDIQLGKDVPLSIEFSYGIAYASEEVESFEALYKLADKQMYNNKTRRKRAKERRTH